MSIIEKLRNEIEIRINRETQYILMLASDRCTSEGKQLLAEKIKDNDKTLRLIGEFTITAKEWTTLGEWEQFYKDKYWDSRE